MGEQSRAVVLRVFVHVSIISILVNLTMVVLHVFEGNLSYRCSANTTSAPIFAAKFHIRPVLLT